MRSSTRWPEASDPSTTSWRGSVLPNRRCRSTCASLREVGAVEVRGDGRRRLYRLNGQALKPIHDWVRAYEQTWSERFDQLDVVLDELKTEEEEDGSDR